MRCGKRSTIWPNKRVCKPCVVSPTPASRRRSQAPAHDTGSHPCELSKIQIGDIHLETTTGQNLRLRRAARPNAEQKRILDALGVQIPERLSPDRLL